jgi:hypothetical protein
MTTGQWVAQDEAPSNLEGLLDGTNDCLTVIVYESTGREFAAGK